MESSSELSPSSTKYRILIMDDDLNISQLLQDALEDEYDTRYSTEPLRFMDEVRAFHPHVVLLDMMMPYLDGRDQLRLMTFTEKQGGSVASLEQTTDTPVSTATIHTMPQVIVITADPTVSADDVELQKCGVRAVLHKPFDLDELFSLIKMTLESEAKPV